MTRDPEVSLSALFARLVESGEASVGPHDILAAERTIVARSCGNTAAYLAALRRARATRAVARGILGDELRRRSIQARLTVPSPSTAELAELQQTYGTVRAREVQVDPAPSWLPDGRGVALGLDAPEQIFLAARPGGESPNLRGRVHGPRACGHIAAGRDSRRGGAPGDQAALRTAAQADRYHSWTALEQKRALDDLRCTRDRLPQVGGVELTSYLPFLTLTEAA